MISETWKIILIVLAAIWSGIWMGLGMWKACKKDHKAWFIVFIIVHTLGILEILYLYWFSELKCCNKKGKKKK